MKKVLILIGDVANGHRSAANAVTESFKQLYPNDYEVKTIDLFTYLEIEPFNSADTFHKFISQNKFYEQINNIGLKFLNTQIGFPFLRSYLKKLYEPTLELINEENPDLIISIHPITTTVLRELKLNNAIQVKTVSIITDLVSILRSCTDDRSELVFCPTSEAVSKLIRWGVDLKNIVYPLFPINPMLKNFRDRETVLKELNLDLTKQTVLLTGGGFGVKTLNKAIKKILKDHKNLQMIIIAGKNDSFKNYLLNEYGSNSSVAILGYVNNIQDYFNASDIVIGKPGPATVLEFEIFNKKAILTKKIGEQESGNIDYAKGNPMFRYIGEDWSKLDGAINELISLETRDGVKNSRRSFDECLEIVKEINKLF